MPDISMCRALKCEIKDTCYRFTAKPSRFRQAFLTPTVIGKECKQYWPVDEEEK